ncbi:periplasmic Cu(I)/Cu(II)-binding protein CopK [Ralstonia sp. SET104]|uniref:periplasmic Cu(I)/Cu(II)-binding protein CopK n=1 Tax=Ralstonia sp. SET104 TaxID=2448774 RepID=UPI000F5628C6|nr:periplasmic Cu(I)/Cu(II)-binding protein CopK [Ralstonia sp. SET104]GCB05268.1 hypothetical protein PSUB009319_28990 [Ralstonia sp. SET104]
MYRDFVIAAVVAVAPLFAFAADMTDVVKTYELKNGSTVYVFKNGNMGVENKFGQAVRVKEGQVMETKDGTTIVMKGNELARVEVLLLRRNRYGY